MFLLCYASPSFRIHATFCCEAAAVVGGSFSNLRYASGTSVCRTDCCWMSRDLANRIAYQTELIPISPLLASMVGRIADLGMAHISRSHSRLLESLHHEEMGTGRHDLRSYAIRSCQS